MDIKKRFKKQLKEIDASLENFLSNGEPKTLYNAVRHLPLAGGKRLRPLLAMTSAEAVGGEGTKTLPFGLSLELIHNFTLVHDDIMDKARLRRGLETVHIKFGEPTAIIAGDTLFAKAFEILHNLDVDPLKFKEINKLLVLHVEEICEGQQIDMEFEGKKKVDEKKYLTMISKKTASLFSCATEGGAIIGRGNKKEVEALSKYGKYFGLAFQIWDDYLDLSGDEKEFGKVIGNDIRDGKKTLMVIHALKHADNKQKNKLLSILGRKDASEEDIHQAIKI
ncbi:MAG TPA: polyprenyl synthetase family protein [Thermoplasmatales archaeon]|nr:polyprenyl synthetase family protein [Thermoplasmatales archaeon]